MYSSAVTIQRFCCAQMQHSKGSVQAFYTYDTISTWYKPGMNYMK